MRLTTRGKVVVGFASLLALVFIQYLVGHINWVGTHYCWGTIEHCYFGGK